MKSVLKIFAAILIILNTSTYGLESGDNDDLPRDTKSLYIEDKTLETLDFSQDFPRLERLSLKPLLRGEDMKRDLERATDDLGLRNNEKLKRLDVNGHVYSNILSLTYVPSLKTLWIYGHVNIDFTVFPNLYEARLAGNFTAETLENLLQLPKLKILYIDSTNRVLSEETMELLGQFKHLKELGIFYRLALPGRFGQPYPDKSEYMKQRLKEMLPKTKILFI